MKSTLILVLLSGALLAYILIFERQQPTAREAVALAQASIDTEGAYAIEIKRAGETVTIEKSAAEWFVTTPVRDRADGALVKGWLKDLRELETAEIIDRKEIESAAVSPSEIGLVPGEALEVTIKREAREAVSLRVGETGAFAGGTYLAFPGDPAHPHVYLVNGDLRSFVTTPVDDLRDPKPFVFPLAGAAALQVTAGKLETRLGRVSPVASWRILEPIRGRADGETVQRLFGSLFNVESEAIAAPSELENLTAERLLATVDATPFADGEVNPVRLSIYAGDGETSGPKALWLTLDDRPATVLVVAREALEELLKSAPRPDVFRDRRAVAMPFSKIEHIAIESQTHPPFHLLRSSGEKSLWQLGRDEFETLEAANAERVGTLLRSLKNARARNIVAVADGEQLAARGLDSPEVIVHFVAFGVIPEETENNVLTDSSGQTAASFDLSLGVVGGNRGGLAKRPMRVYARFNDEPVAAELGPEILTALPTQPARWKGLSLFRFDLIQLKQIRIERKPKSSSVTLNYDPYRDAWSLAGSKGKVKADGAGAGDEPRPVDAQSARELAQRLGILTASDWLASGADAYAALDQPSHTITVRLDVPTKSGDRIETIDTVIALAPAPGGRHYYGRLGSAPDVFLIETEAIDGLETLADKLPK